MPFPAYAHPFCRANEQKYPRIRLLNSDIKVSNIFLCLYVPVATFLMICVSSFTSSHYVLLYFLNRCISYTLFHFPVWGRSSRVFPGGGARTVYLRRWNYMLGKDLPYFHWLVHLVVLYCLNTPL